MNVFVISCMNDRDSVAVLSPLVRTFVWTAVEQMYQDLSISNDIIESHEAGKKAANMNASVNAIKSKGDNGKNHSQQFKNSKKDQISNA